ncbi:MAG: hypothetical protein V4805_03025 [Pseudomonadota bacterium]
MANLENQPQSLAERKKQILAEGAAYRACIVLATQSIKSGFRLDLLARSAANQALHLISAKTGYFLGNLREVKEGNFV